MVRVRRIPEDDPYFGIGKSAKKELVAVYILNYVQTNIKVKFALGRSPVIVKGITTKRAGRVGG